MSRLQRSHFRSRPSWAFGPGLLHFAPLALSLVARELESAPLRALLA